MASLATFDLPTTVQNSAKLLEALRILLAHIDRSESLTNQRVFRLVTDYAIGQLEKCGTAAIRLNIDTLASATRNLFELSFLSDYVCASDQNMQRFIGDCAIDDLEIMDKFGITDQRPRTTRQIRSRWSERAA